MNMLGFDGEKKSTDGKQGFVKKKNITILGLFKTKEEAIEARIKAEQSLFKEFSYANSVRLSNEL